MIELHKIGDFTGNSEKWYIVRKLDDDLKNPDFLHVPELSPSVELFAEYRRLRNIGQWNKETFSEIYVPEFLQNMKSEKAVEKLEILVQESHIKNIALFCYCDDETLCHRSIVGGILKGLFADISCSDEYLKYFEMYKKIK